MGPVSKRAKKMKKLHDIEKVSFTEKKMLLTVDGKEYTFQLSDISRKLANASRIEKEKYEISPSGYGIHWPLIDEDLSIDRLIGIRHSPSKNKESISA
jgi:hypothetical protein